MAGAAKRNITLAWQVAALTASASVGKLPALDSLMGQHNPSGDNAQLLSGLFKLKSRGVPMTIERLH